MKMILGWMDSVSKDGAVSRKKEEEGQKTENQ